MSSYFDINLELIRDAQPLRIADGENESLHRLGGDILRKTYPRKKVDTLF